MAKKSKKDDKNGDRKGRDGKGNNKGGKSKPETECHRLLGSVEPPVVAWNGAGPPNSANVTAQLTFNPAIETFEKAILTCKNNTTGLSVGMPVTMTFTPPATVSKTNAFPNGFVAGHEYEFTVNADFLVRQRSSSAATKQAP